MICKQKSFFVFLVLVLVSAQAFAALPSWLVGKEGKQIEQLEAEILEKETEIKSLESSLQIYKSESLKLAEDSKLLLTQMKELQTQLQTAQTQLQTAKTELETSQIQLKELQSKLSASQTEMDLTQEQLKIADAPWNYTAGGFVLADGSGISDVGLEGTLYYDQLGLSLGAYTDTYVQDISLSDVNIKVGASFKSK